MPVVNRSTPVENISVPVPTPIQTQPQQQSPAPTQQIQAPQPKRPHRHLPLSFGGENDEFGRRVQGVSAVILPWSPQQNKLSRKKMVIRYTRPSLTPTQKERAKKVELVVLPKSISGKSCGTCQYAKKHGESGLYCTNNSVHMNVKSNWGCKLWDAKGVKKLSRKRVLFT